MAFNFNPLIALTVPIRFWAPGWSYLPTKDPKDAIVTFFITSANGNPTTSGFGDLHGNAITVAAEGRVRTDFFGFTGHQLFGTTYIDRSEVRQGHDREQRAQG
jgi:hypothetical protein